MSTGGKQRGSAAGTKGTNCSEEGCRPAEGRERGRGPAGNLEGTANSPRKGPAAGHGGVATAPLQAWTASGRPLHPLMDYKEVAATLGLSVPRARLWCRRHGVALIREGRWHRVVRVSLLDTIAGCITR